MSRREGGVLRHAASDGCTRCGAEIPSDQGLYVLRETLGTPDEETRLLSGNLCEACFSDACNFMQGEE